MCSLDTARPSRATCEKGNTWHGLLGAPTGKKRLGNFSKRFGKLLQIGRSWVLCPSTKSRKVMQGVCLSLSTELCQTQPVPRPAGSPPGVVPHQTSRSTQVSDFAGGMSVEDFWIILNHILNNQWNDNYMVWYDLMSKIRIERGKNETCNYWTNEGHKPHIKEQGILTSSPLTTSTYMAHPKLAKLPQYLSGPTLPKRVSSVLSNINVLNVVDMMLQPKKILPPLEVTSRVSKCQFLCLKSTWWIAILLISRWQI